MHDPYFRDTFNFLMAVLHYRILRDISARNKEEQLIIRDVLFDMLERIDVTHNSTTSLQLVGNCEGIIIKVANLVSEFKGWCNTICGRENALPCLQWCSQVLQSLVYQRENGEKDMSKMNPGVLFDASRSWNGYNHQGKLALVYAIQEITKLVCDGASEAEDREKLKPHFLEIEYMEDFSIGKFLANGDAAYVSVHQVKDRKETAPSAYKSAIQGLVKHLIDEPSIEKAYLHVTSQLALQKTFREYVSEMVADLQWITDYEKKIKKKEDTPENRAFLAELGEMRRQFQSVPKSQMAKVALYSYRIAGKSQTFCPEDQGGVLLKEALTGFYQKKFPSTYKPGASFVEKSYLYMMGKLDQHVVERSLNYDAYKAEDKDRRILFSQIYDWLISDEIGANGDDFYLYHIKEEYFRLADGYCKKCRRSNGNCRQDCQVPIFKDKLGALSFSALKTFMYRTNPDVARRLDMGTYSLFLQTGKVKNPLLKGMHEILETITEGAEFDAVSYRDHDNIQYALTTLARDDQNDEDEDREICTNIVKNEHAFPLLMDYDYLISRDVTSESIYASSLSVVQDDIGRDGENIFYPKKVKIITLEQFLESTQEGQ